MEMTGWGFLDISLQTEKGDFSIFLFPFWKQRHLLDAWWGHGHNHLKCLWMMNVKFHKARWKQADRSSAWAFCLVCICFHSALWSLFPRWSTALLQCPLCLECFDTHSCLLKSYPFFKALFKLLLWEEFPNCLWRHKSCFYIGSLGLSYSTDHILCSAIVVSMAMSMVHPLNMGLDSASHSQAPPMITNMSWCSVSASWIVSQYCKKLQLGIGKAHYSASCFG